MKYSKNYKFSFFFFAAIFFSQLSFGQLSNFTLQVTPTDETCTANGSLSFTVTNTTPGATLVYTIYHLPNTTTPISVQSTTTFGGLVAGNYRVVATQSLGSEPGTQQQDVIINSDVHLLTYQTEVQNVRCGHDGKITVNVMTGPGPYHYELFQGPAIYPLQTSNVFSGLDAGQYSLRVFDNCGEGVVQIVTIGTDITTLDFYNHYYSLLSCNTIQVHDQVQPTTLQGGFIVYPLTVKYIIHPPSGPPIPLAAQTISSGVASSAPFWETIPYYYNQPFSYDIRVTDGCGRTFQTSYQMHIQLNLELYLSAGCGGGIVITPFDAVFPYTVTFLSAPTSNFNPALYNPNHPGPFNEAATYLGNLPVGNYTIQVTDACGRTDVETVYVSPPANISPVLYVSEGCQEGYGGVFIYPFITLTSVRIIHASVDFGYPVPYNVSGYINTNGFFIMGPLPAGVYTFATVDVCGNHNESVAVIEGYHETTTINIIPHCGSFDIDLHNSSNSLATPAYWLQKFNPLTQQWVHPLTGVAYSGPIPSTSNSIELLNNSINYNFSFTGAFRIVKYFTVFENGSYGNCVEVLKEFTFDGLPKINKVYSFSCNNGFYDVIVDAIGSPPLIYRIVEKDGQPYVVQNANSYVFLGIPAGHYKFQVEDSCGNILNSEFDVPTPFNFGITPANLCNGLAGSLTVPNFSILQYQWWKDNASTTILSTTNSLSFPSFNLATNAGVYHVRVRYTGNPNSCIDFVLNYTISATPIIPIAGQDADITYCGNQGAIDLFSLLTGAFDTNGTWSEISNSGTLVDNIWNSTTVAPGQYQFEYRVDDFCGAFDESFVTITIKPIPEIPVAFLEQAVCETHSLNLLASTVPNGTYEWNGPNGFTSNEQNPIINPVSALNGGTYTVNAVENGCESETSSVEVLVAPLPQFTLGNDCIEDAYTLTATVVNNPGTAPLNFSWTGPNNYASTENPINITGLIKGEYFLTVTNADGCSFTDSVHVLNTLCVIQQGVSVNDDGDNDALNLLGFDVKNLKIFNRYGMIVYEQDNYINQWHGQDYNNNELPGATYYYQVTLPTGVIKTGWVYLIRK